MDVVVVVVVDVNMDVGVVVDVDRLASPLSSSFVPSVFLIDATRKRWHLTYYNDRKLMDLLFIKAKKNSKQTTKPHLASFGLIYNESPNAGKLLLVSSRVLY